jgi:hypothetical protein
MTPLEASTRLLSQREEVRFFPDHWLNKSLLTFLRPHDVPRVHAEILLRWWLYQGECPQCILDATGAVENQLRDFVETKLLPLRAKRVRHGEKLAFEDRQGASNPPSATERLFKTLLLSYAEADGIFPVVRWGAAVPIPFQIGPPHQNQGAVCAGATQFPKWTAEAAHLWREEGVFQINIQAEFDQSMADNMEGGSFALAALLAKEFRGDVCRFEWMATGSIRADKIGAVEGIEAKAALARKLGVRLWIFPGESGHEPSAEGSLPLPVGLGLKTAVDEVGAAFAKSGIRKLSPSGAIAMIERIQPRGSIARKPLSRAIERVQSALGALENNPRFVGPNIIQGRLLLAELLNHCGKERDADPILRGLLNKFPGDWKLLANAGPKLVVSLCYQGSLCAAAAEGKKLFQQLDTFPETLTGLEARVKVAGSYGGDALLHLALRTGSGALAQKSRACLELNLNYAKELADLAGASTDTEMHPRFSLGMSISRMAVWYALFEPESVQQCVDQSLKSLPEVDANVGYLRRTLFLGMYRLLLANKQPPDLNTILSREMPLESAAHYIRATAFKYRGALLAHGGRPDMAEEDFRTGFELLRQDPTETIQLIAWGIAAQAVLSLPGNSAFFANHVRDEGWRAAHYLERFHPSRKLASAFRDQNWGTEDLHRFQMGFAY